MFWLLIVGLVASGAIPFLLVHHRVRRPAAWAVGGLFVYLAIQAGMRFVMEEASGHEYYGLNALTKARDEGAIKDDVYQRERTRTIHAFIASLVTAVAASAGYGVAVRISSKRKSA
jgi:hypothetical protein